MNLLKDVFGDKSSGLLMMIVMFIAAVTVANIGVCMGADLGQLALLVGAFLVPVAGGQIGQALQRTPQTQSTDDSKSQSESLGILQNPFGSVDLGRILKLVAVFIAVELAILVMIVRRDTGLVGMAQICGAFLAYATASEISQKAAGI